MGATSKRRVCIFVEAVMSARKRYRPKGVSADSWKIAIQGSCLLSKADQKARADLLSDAVEKIGKGQGSKEIWQSVFDCMNMLEAFSRMPKVMRNADDYIESMQSVIVGLLDRQKQTGTKALYASELADLRGLVETWRDVLSTVTHAEYFQAEERTHQRLKAILSSKTRGVRVVEVV